MPLPLEPGLREICPKCALCSDPDSRGSPGTPPSLYQASKPTSPPLSCLRTATMALNDSIVSDEVKDKGVF